MFALHVAVVHRSVVRPLVFAIVAVMLFGHSAAAQTARRPASPPLPAGDPWGSRGYLDVNALFDALSNTAEVATEHEINAETATITAEQETGRRVLVDVGFGRRIRRNVGIGGSVTYGATSKDAEITGDIPHPFYFNQPRPLSGTAALERRDLMVHVHPMWFAQLSPRLSTTVFGGATWFRVEQEALESPILVDSYPYDEVALANIERRRETASRWGGHVGGDLAYALNRHVGIHALARYARGTVTIAANDVDSDVTVGGLHVGAGLRFRF